MSVVRSEELRSAGGRVRTASLQCSTFSRWVLDYTVRWGLSHAQHVRQRETERVIIHIEQIVELREFRIIMPPHQSSLVLVVSLVPLLAFSPDTEGK